MGAHHIAYQPNEVELAYVRKAYEQSTAFITICGGIQAALMSGILAGKTATCPRFMIPQAKQMSPTTNWEEKRYSHDGKLWTSGALLNGMDLMRAFALEYWGDKGSLTQTLIDMGHWPIRDINYADATSNF